MGAVEKKHEAMVNLLLENGSNPNLFNDDGKNMSKILPWAEIHKFERVALPLSNEYPLK